MFPLYKRLETNDAPGDHHGRSGPVKLRTLKGEDPCGSALLAASGACSIMLIVTIYHTVHVLTLNFGCLTAAPNVYVSRFVQKLGS